jgi:hypothetical protein
MCLSWTTCLAANCCLSGSCHYKNPDKQLRYDKITMIGILPVAYQILQLHKNYNDWYITCSLSDFTIAQKLQ